MKICMRCCAALLLIASLTACAGTSPVSCAGESQRSGVTVLGDIDVGVGRVQK